MEPSQHGTLFWSKQQNHSTFDWYKTSELVFDSSKDAAYLDISCHLSDGRRNLLFEPLQK